NFSLAVILAISSIGLTVHAQELQNTQKASQTLNLSNAQVFKIQALYFSQTEQVRALALDVQEAQESVRAAVAKDDPVLLAAAILSLDAAEKALQNTQAANQRDLQSLLDESQKEVMKEYSTHPVATGGN